MTMLVATLGLLPAALSHGIGSDSQRPFAIVIVGGLISDLVMSIFFCCQPYMSGWQGGMMCCQKWMQEERCDLRELAAAQSLGAAPAPLEAAG
jgi:hypothetical protein